MLVLYLIFVLLMGKKRIIKNYIVFKVSINLKFLF
jgi:hypothetical protein